MARHGSSDAPRHAPSYAGSAFRFQTEHGASAPGGRPLSLLPPEMIEVDEEDDMDELLGNLGTYRASSIPVVVTYDDIHSDEIQCHALALQFLAVTPACWHGMRWS